MAIYVVGDIQGCMTSMEALLLEMGRHGFRMDRDEVWLAGDLVNRGPRSLDVVRWAYANRGRVHAVLGNHDVHALLRYAGHAKEKKRDTLDDLLAATDAPVLFDWLRRQPFLRQARVGTTQWVMVHAGLAPSWSVATASELAGELSAAMGGEAWRARLGRFVGKGTAWRDELRDEARILSLMLYFTRVRTLLPSGEPDPEFDGPLDELPKGHTPWFAWKQAAWQQPLAPRLTTRVVFGHWAALGVTSSPHHQSLDSGCVWGRALTAMRLDDGEIIAVPARD